MCLQFNIFYSTGVFLFLQASGCGYWQELIEATVLDRVMSGVPLFHYAKDTNLSTITFSSFPNLKLVGLTRL